VVGKKKVKHARLAAPRREKVVSRRPGRCLNACAWFGLAPIQDMVGDTEASKPTAHIARFACRFRPQPVIHGQRRRRAGPASRPSIGEQDEGKAIGTAGNGDGERGGPFEGSERFHQRREKPFRYSQFAARPLRFRASARGLRVRTQLQPLCSF
jgi:hypothetical protein